MQLQGLPAGNRTRVLWITRPVLYHWATEAVTDNLGKLDLNQKLRLYWAQKYGILTHSINSFVHCKILNSYQDKNSYFKQ